MTTEQDKSLHPDELEIDEEFWGRKPETKETLHMMLSHHPPSMYGHCLRLSFRGHSLYLCGRCTGIYGGLGIGLLLLFILRINLQPGWLWFAIALIMGFSTVIDWMSQRLTPRKTTNLIRAGTGFMSGFGLAIVFFIGNLVYLLITLMVMLVSVGGVGLVESRRFRTERTEFGLEDPEDVSSEDIE